MYSEHNANDQVVHRLTHQALAGPISAAAAVEMFEDHRERWPDCPEYRTRVRHLRLIQGEA